LEEPQIALHVVYLQSGTGEDRAANWFFERGAALAEEARDSGMARNGFGLQGLKGKQRTSGHQGIERPSNGIERRSGASWRTLITTHGGCAWL
jgi:hypothetical protein